MREFVLACLIVLAFCGMVTVMFIGQPDVITQQCMDKGFITHGDFNLICERIVR
jgi:hypothetical protein